MLERKPGLLTTVFSAWLGLSCVSTVCLVTGGQEAPEGPADPAAGQSSRPRRWPGFRGDGWVWWQKRPQRPARGAAQQPWGEPQLGESPERGRPTTGRAAGIGGRSLERGLDHDDDYGRARERSRGAAPSGAWTTMITGEPGRAAAAGTLTRLRSRHPEWEYGPQGLSLMAGMGVQSRSREHLHSRSPSPRPRGGRTQTSPSGSSWWKQQWR